MKKKPAEVLSMITQIRQERDDFRDVTVRFQTMQNELEEAIRAQEASNKLNEESNETARDWRTRAMDLQTALNIANHKANKADLPGDQTTERSHVTTKYEKTSRLPDPPIFTDGLDPTWDDWSSKIEHKLEANMDHYPTEKARLAYVIGRIGGDAAKHTMPRRLRNCSNPYATAEEILDQLAEIYEDANREENADREYRALVQGSRPFAEFYSDFIRITSALSRKDEKDLLREMSHKLRKGLKTAYDLKAPFDSLKAAKEALLRLDNIQRDEYNQKAASAPKTVTTTARRTRLTPLAATPTITQSGTTSINAPAMKTKEMAGGKEPTCHMCGKVGHYRRDCTLQIQNEAGKKASQEARLHAFEMDEEYESDDVGFDTKHHDSSSDSGNE